MLQVLAQLPPASARQSSAILSSIEFDRDAEYFATAGVSKRISIFDFADVLNKPYTDVHSPALEISTRSKLSCVAWHKYVKSHLISSDYEGGHPAQSPQPAKSPQALKHWKSILVSSGSGLPGILRARSAPCGVLRLRVPKRLRAEGEVPRWPRVTCRGLSAGA